MKKKILSLMMSICMVICSLFSLAGCSVVSEDTATQNKKEVVKIGNTNLTKADIINSFSSYYQSNNSYFSYYDEETIVESFYTWFQIKQIVKQKSQEALYDAETNPTGFIIYSQKDADDVLDSTFEYIYSQVSAYEKAIYELKNVEEDKYPSWLQSEEEEESSTGYEYYKSTKPEIETKTPADAVEKLTEEQVKSHFDELTEYLFEYVSKKAESEDEEDVRADIDETASKNYIVGARNEAYAKYVENLVINAEAAGKPSDTATVLLNELVRVYDAYYESKITTLFQDYYLKNHLLDTENGDTVTLSDAAIVEMYLKAYYTDVQLYQVEDSYVATMTDSENGASLVLYNYDGKYYFFTVQHILVQFDDVLTEEVKNLPGYSSNSSGLDSVIHDEFLEKRNELADTRVMLTEINKDAVSQFENSINVVGGYYFIDEELEGDARYVELNTTLVNDETVYTRSDNGEEVDADDAKYMASVNDIISCYNANLLTWENLVRSYIEAADDNARKVIYDANEEMQYIFDVVNNMIDFDNYTFSDIDTVMQKVASFLWVELQWIYSSDSLGNELSNKIGYVVSSQDDENGSWVVDFAVGARNILKSIVDGDTSVIGSSNVVTSDYGKHIIKIDNIYKPGESLVDMSGFASEEIDLTNAEFVEEMAELLRKTYVCASSNQTLFDYYYDQLYEELVGSSESSGSYFMKLQYEWLAEYNEANKIEISTKYTYDELMDMINK